MKLGLGLGFNRRGGGLEPLTDFFLTGDEAAENAAVGTVVGYVIPIGGGPDYTYSVTNNSNFIMVGNELQVNADLTGLTSEFVTIQVDNIQKDYTITVSAFFDQTPGGGLDDGFSYVNNGFVVTPEATAQSTGVKLSGRSGGNAFLVRDIGTPYANHKLTINYTPDFSKLKKIGKDSFVGFGLLNDSTGDFWFGGLGGDGTGGVVRRQIYGAGKFTASSGWTVVNGSAPTNGTLNGPNWLRALISSNGTSIKIQSSSTGAMGSFVDELNVTPAPFTNATDALRFGLAVFIPTSDKGSFEINATRWRENLWHGVLKEMQGTGPTQGGTTYTIPSDTTIIDTLGTNVGDRTYLQDYEGRFYQSGGVVKQTTALTNGNNELFASRLMTELDTIISLGARNDNMGNNANLTTVFGSSGPEHITGANWTDPGHWAAPAYYLTSVQTVDTADPHLVYRVEEVMPKHFRGIMRSRTGSNQGVSGTGWATNFLNMNTLNYNTVSPATDYYATDTTNSIRFEYDEQVPGDYVVSGIANRIEGDTNWIELFGGLVTDTVRDWDNGSYKDSGGPNNQNDSIRGSAVNLTHTANRDTFMRSRHHHNSTTPASLIADARASYNWAYIVEDYMGVRVETVGVANQFIAAAWESIIWGTVVHEVGADWVDLGTSNTKIIIPAGVTKVAVNAGISWNQIGSSAHKMRTILNGSTHEGMLYSEVYAFTTTSQSRTNGHALMIPVTAGDELELQCWTQNSKSTMSINLSYLNVYAIEHSF